MKTLKLLGFFLLLSSATAFAQKYMMVYAPLDLYVDLQDNDGKTVGQVFNLEVVYVENEPSAMNTRILTHNNLGYIPSNYLVNIPEKYYAQIHRMWSDGTLFIASIETPSVLVTVTSSDFRINDNGNSVSFNTQGLYVSDLANNKLLDYVGASFPYSITVGEKNLTLECNFYYYSFFLDSENNVVRLLTPLYNRIYSTNESEEPEQVLSQAVEVVGSAKLLEKHSDTDRKNSLAYNEMVRVIGYNNFHFLAQLGRLYASGDRQAEKLYPFVERYFPVDDDQVVTFDEISAKVWGLRNKGRTIIN